MEGHIRTYLGHYFNPLDPEEDKIDILDIAHALGQSARFSGHLPEFYSVAQHCVLGLSFIDEEELKLPWLLHDASEAYLIDMPSPVKAMFPDYKAAEKRLSEVIFRKFGIATPLDPRIKEVDSRMFDWEWHKLMLGAPNFPSIKCWSPKEAEEEFLGAFVKLTIKEHA